MGRASDRKTGCEGEPRSVRQGNGDPQLTGAGDAAKTMHHGAVRHHHMPGSEERTLGERRPHTRLARRAQREPIGKVTADRRGRRHITIRIRTPRSLGGKRDTEPLIAERRNNARPRVARSLLGQAGQIGDALGGGKSADRAHRLLAVGSIDLRPHRVRDNEAGQQDEQGLSEQALGEEAGHSWLTAGVSTYPPPHTVLMICGSAGSASSLRRSRLTWVSTLRSSAVVAWPCVRSSS